MPGRPDTDQGAGGWKRPAAWASTVTATALGGVGVLALLTYNSDIQTFNEYMSQELTTPDKKCGDEVVGKGGPYCQKLINHADSMKRWAIIGFGGAAVAGTVAAILFVTSAPAETAAIRPARGLALACAPSIVGTMGGACAMRF
jgi:hypothetical protein